MASSAMSLAQPQNVKTTLTPAEIKAIDKVDTRVSLAWTDLHSGKLSDIPEILSELRQTPNAEHVNIQAYASEQADMLQARVDMVQGSFAHAAALFEKHLRYGSAAHSRSDDPYVVRGATGDLQIGDATGAQCFRLADLAVCLAKAHRYPAALRVYRAGLRTLRDGSRLETPSEPVPLDQTFPSGISAANLSRFEAACYLMAAVSTQQNGNEEWMTGYANKAAATDPSWEVARFYASYLPLQFTNFPNRLARRTTYEGGLAACATTSLKTLLDQAFKTEKVTPLGSGDDMRKRSGVLLEDLAEIRRLASSGQPLLN